MGKRPAHREGDKPIFDVSEMTEWKNRALTAERKLASTIEVMEWVSSVWGVVIPAGDAAQGFANFQAVLTSIKKG